MRITIDISLQYRSEYLTELADVFFTGRSEGGGLGRRSTGVYHGRRNGRHHCPGSHQRRWFHQHIHHQRWAPQDECVQLQRGYLAEVTTSMICCASTLNNGTGWLGFRWRVWFWWFRKWMPTYSLFVAWPYQHGSANCHFTIMGHDCKSARYKRAGIDLDVWRGVTEHMHYIHAW